MHPRLIREQKTVDLMIDLYCRDKHGMTAGICEDCQEIKDYVHVRLKKCPYQEKKTICANCKTHCYQKIMQDRIRKIMMYGGPRMLIRHPGLTVLHLMDGFRKPVLLKDIKAKKTQSN